MRKRRFAESEIFGLYDNRDAVSVEEAVDVYRMYQSNRAEIDRVERRFGVTIDGIEARPNRIAQANRDYSEIIGEYGGIRTISEALSPARTVLLEHLRVRYPEHAIEFTEERFNTGQIDLARYPVHASQEHDPGRPASGDGMDRAPGRDASASGPFNDPFADRYFAAVMAGDSDLADRIAIEFAQSPEGQRLARLGDEALAQQQALERQQAQDEQMVRQEPMVRM